MSRFAAAWLGLRETADAASRDAELARRFAAALPRAPRIVDLGAGTGANARYLAPLIGGEQIWHLVEHDPALRAARLDIPTSGDARWRFVDEALDLAHGWERLDALTPHGVTAVAMFDLASAAWLERLAEWLGARQLPLLAALTVDGRRQWQPALAEDVVVAAAFRKHQERDKGLGPALGGAASAVLAQALAAHGFSVVTAASDWRLGAGDSELLATLVAGEAAAAHEAGADPRAVAVWERARRAAAARGALALTVGHRDLLALPAQI